MLVLEIIGGLLILVFLVVLHEFGHAIAARRNGVVVEEFGIGFPPRVWGRKLKNGILFSINWLPFGGFVRLQGEHDAADQPGDYGAATLWQKTRILLAGVMINWLTAAVLLTILSWTGLPKILSYQFEMPGDTYTKSTPVQVAAVVPGSPADKAGLRTGDSILYMDGAPMATPADLSTATKQHAGQTVEIIYTRGDRDVTVRTTLNKEAGHSGFLGVNSAQSAVSHSTWSAPIVGVVTTAQFTGETVKGLGDLVVNLAKGIALQFSPDRAARQLANSSLNAVGDMVSGPVGVVGVFFPAAEKAGPTQLVLLTALISLSLAVMNVLPIPGLDGARWYLMSIFRILKKPLTKAREEKIQATGLAILGLLFVAITVTDIAKLF